MCCVPNGWLCGARASGALGLLTIGIDVVSGGRPAEPWWRPTSKVSAGPSGLPTLTRSPSWMSTTGTRRLWTYRPLRLPLSTAIHRPWSYRTIRWVREIRGWATRRSARRSRPITTSLPGAKVRSDPSYRTVSAGGAGEVIRTNCNGSGAAYALGCSSGSASPNRQRVRAAGNHTRLPKRGKQLSVEPTCGAVTFKTFNRRPRHCAGCAGSEPWRERR